MMHLFLTLFISDVNLPVLRNVMRNFYSPLKDCEPMLRFVFSDRYYEVLAIEYL